MDGVVKRSNSKLTGPQETVQVLQEEGSAVTKQEPRAKTEATKIPILNACLIPLRKKQK